MKNTIKILYLSWFSGMEVNETQNDEFYISFIFYFYHSESLNFLLLLFFWENQIMTSISGAFVHICLIY